MKPKNDIRFRSSWAIQLIFKSLPLLFGIMFLAIGASLLIFNVSKDSEGNPIPESLKYTFIAISLPLASIFYFIRDKFGVVEIVGDEIFLERRGSRSIKSWSGVSKVFKLPFTAPPIYRISFKDGEKPIYFAFFSVFSVYTPIFSYDFTGFLAYARKKLDELKIDAPP